MIPSHQYLMLRPNAAPKNASMPQKMNMIARK